MSYPHILRAKCRRERPRPYGPSCADVAQTTTSGLLAGHQKTD
jgi:hypothetical protein